MCHIYKAANSQLLAVPLNMLNPMKKHVLVLWGQQFKDHSQPICTALCLPVLRLSKETVSQPHCVSAFRTVTSNSAAGGCGVDIIVVDGGVPFPRNICSGSARERYLYTSTNSDIQFYVNNRGTPQELGNFLLHYKREQLVLFVLNYVLFDHFIMKWNYFEFE